MVEPPARKSQACANIFAFEIRHLFEDLFGRETARQQIQNVSDTDAHAADTGTSATLLWVHRYTIR